MISEYACHDSTCSGHGVCLPLKYLPFYRCRCYHGYTGSRCETPRKWSFEKTHPCNSCGFNGFLLVGRLNALFFSLCFGFLRRTKRTQIFVADKQAICFFHFDTPVKREKIQCFLNRGKPLGFTLPNIEFLTFVSSHMKTTRSLRV